LTTQKYVDGFWLPKEARQKILNDRTEYILSSFDKGRPAAPVDPGAVTARWPRLELADWRDLLEILEQNRARTPQGDEYWKRLRDALEAVAARLSDPDNPLHTLAIETLPGYTGYSQAMIAATLNSMDMMSLDEMPLAFKNIPAGHATQDWIPMEGLSGRLRFYPASPIQSAAYRLPGLGGRPLFGDLEDLNLVVGFGAGNVPGAALMIAFLAQACTLAGGRMPTAVIKNSRREPIFSPLVLSALEDVDPDLVASIVVLVWDYQGSEVQDLLLSEADLVLAAASDETINQVGAQIDHAAPQRAPGKRAPRFHAHGHKVSFSAIGKSVMTQGLTKTTGGTPLLEIVGLLAALDSIFWDQHGCLSSRVHFVETGGANHHTPLEYANKLKTHMAMLAQVLPRGAWPLQQIHDRFDRYKQLESTGLVSVLSGYDDEFLVVLDERPMSGAAFFSLVNDCQGRVVFVRPVADLMDIPDKYFRLLPPQNLQSLSVAIGAPGEGLSSQFLDFASSCGARGVTAIRTVGRAAFPQLSYSWDGLIPLDLVRSRPSGRFATIEFDHPYDEILATYNLYLKAGGALGMGG